MKQSEYSSAPLVNFDYLSEELPIIIQDRTIDMLDSISMSSHFREDFVWVRMMSGSIEVDVDGTIETIREGECLFINSNHIRELRGVPDGPARYRILIVRPDAVCNPLLSRRLNRMMQDTRFSSTVIRPGSPLFYADMDAMLELSRHKPEEYEFRILSHLLVQFSQILRIYHHTNPDDTITKNTDLDTLREMLAFIGENCREELTLDQIAAAGKVSRSKCTRLFRTYIQKSPIHHLQAYRLERSVYLLNNTEFTISEIALKCGFNQPSYYNRLFLRTFGITPKAMRARHAAKKEEAEG